MVSVRNTSQPSQTVPTPAHEAQGTDNNAEKRMLSDRQDAPKGPSGTPGSEGLDPSRRTPAALRAGLSQHEAAMRSRIETGTAPTARSEAVPDDLAGVLRSGFADRTAQLAADDPAAFAAIAEQAFGSKGQSVADAARAGTLPEPANIRFVDRETLQGADGAYAPDGGGTVYLARDLQDEPATLQRVYDEEAAHHLDRALGGPDATGDEGQVFAAGLARGAPLEAEALAAARAEKDTSTILVDGREVQVENSLLDVFNLAASAASWIPGVGDAASIVSAAVNAAAGNYPAALLDVISVIPGVGDAIGSAGKLLLQNRLSRELASELAGQLARHGPRLKEGIVAALHKARSSNMISRSQFDTLVGTLDRQVDELAELARRAARIPNRNFNGISTQQWDHIHNRHITGLRPDGTPYPDSPDLFPSGTSRADIEAAARDVIENGNRITEDVQRQLQSFERTISVQGQRMRVRAIVDQDTGLLHTIHPVSR